MSKVTKHFSALLAMILSITLMIGTIPTMLRASANPDDTVIWFVPDEQHQVIHTADAAGWWGASWGYQTTYSENGLHFSTKFTGTAVRTGYTQTFDLDGLTFVFDNLTNEQSKAIVTMLISDTTLRTFDPNMSENNMLEIVLDTVNGRLTLEGDTVLLEDEILKYNNITGKAFSIAFHKDGDGYKPTVDVEGTAVTGTTAFTSDMIAARSNITDESHIVVGIAGGDGSDGLTAFDLNKIGGVRKASVKGEKTLTVADFAHPVNYWPDRLALRDAPDGGARMLFYNSGITNIRNCLSDPAKLDGMYLKINNISVINSSFQSNLPEIVFALADNDSEAAENMLALVLDTRNGKLRFSNDAKFLQETHVIISDEALKYENIAQREVVLRTFKNDDGSYKVQLEIEDREPLIGTLPASCIESATLLSNPDQARLIVTPAIPEGEGMPGKVEFMIDLVEFFSTPEGELGASDTDDPDLEPIDGVIYLSKSLLALHGSQDGDKQGTINDWTNKGWIFAKDLKKGVRFQFNFDTPNVRDGYKESMDLKGMQLHFRGFQGTGFGITIGDTSVWTPEFGTNSRSLVICYDAAQKCIYTTTIDEAGTLTKTPLIEDISIPKSAYFTYAFSTDVDRSNITLTVNVDGTEYNGVISKSVLDQAKALTDTTKVEVNINSGGFTGTQQIDYIGVRQLTLVDETAIANVIDAIDAIDDISLENGAPIRAARKLYDLLIAEEREMVTNYNDLLKAEETYQKLATEADRLLTYLEISNSLLNGSDEEAIKQTVSVDWANFFRVSDIPTGGLHIEYTNAVINHRDGYRYKVDSSDLLLQFDNLDAASPEKCKFAVFFGKETEFYGFDYNSHNPPLALVLDAAAGTITAYPSEHIIIQSDYLKLENLRGKRFSYQLTSRGKGEGYDLTVRTAGQELKGEITDEDVSDAPLFPRYNDCLVMVSAWDDTNGTCTCSFDFIGIQQISLQKKVENMVAMIDALPETITKNDIDAVKKALVSFQALPIDLRSEIDNYDKLEKAVAQVYELEKEDTVWSNGVSVDETGRNPDADNIRTGVSFHYAWLLLLVFSLTAVTGIVLFTKKSSLRLTSVKRGERK